MRHRKRTAKLGMKSQHRRATLANLVCSLIKHNRITTTIAKAKETRRYADKMVTLAKKGALHHRRRALAFLREKDAVKKLFAEIGKQHADRNGGYTRVIRVGQRLGDAAEIAIVEWTGTVTPPAETETGKAAQEPKPKAKKSTKAKEASEAKESASVS
jgi:large subunit ribosomal protein L17